MPVLGAFLRHFAKTVCSGCTQRSAAITHLLQGLLCHPPYVLTAGGKNLCMVNVLPVEGKVRTSEELQGAE